jgi:Ca2+-binding EF-hand superfamily protein
MQQQQQLQQQRMNAQNEARIADQKKKMEAMKAQQAMLVQQRAEEQKKKQEQMEQLKLEQQSVLAIRRVMQVFRTSMPEKYDENKKALDEILAQELEKCGSQKERMTQEIEQAIAATKTRLEQIENQRKLENEKKEAENKRRKELKEKADELLAELEKLVEKAETASKSVTEEAEPLTGEKELKIAEVEACATAVEEASKEAMAAITVCAEFVLKESQAIKNTPPIMGEPAPTCAADLGKLVDRINAARKTNTNTTTACSIKKAARIKKAQAQEKLEKTLAPFKKYDTDKDGRLSRKEVQAYCKGTFSFTCPAETLDSIFDSLVEEGAKGVDKANFQRMNILIGIAREAVIDDKRKAAREAREKALQATKEKLQAAIDKVGESVTAGGEAVAKAEEAVKPLNTGGTKDKKAVEMITAADEAHSVIEGTTGALTKAKDAIAALTTEEQELKNFVLSEVKKLENQLKPFDGRLAKATASVQRYRAEATKKDVVELEKLRADGLAIIFHHQGEKNLMGEDVYKEFDKKDKGKVEESGFVKFFSTCEMAEGKERLSEEDAARLFQNLDSEEEGFISKEAFLSLVRKFMKVAKDTVLTEDISIKSTPKRRLGEGEVVEILTGPTKESDDAELSRLKVKAMKDDIEGWVTPVGNQGTIFLEDGGNIFKVVKETILTGCFIIGEESKMKDRKLKVGEVVEVREWARQEEKSGLMRMKVCVRGDGQVGWATSVGNTGIKFLDPQ